MNNKSFISRDPNTTSNGSSPADVCLCLVICIHDDVISPIVTLDGDKTSHYGTSLQWF